MGTCEICGLDAQSIRLGDAYKITCSRCQGYVISGTVAAIIQNLGQREKASLSSWIFRQNERQHGVNLTEPLVRAIVSAPPMPLFDRAENLLLSMVRKQKRYQDKFNIADPWFLAASGSEDHKEANFIARVLEERGYVTISSSGAPVTLTIDGIIHAEDQLLVKAGSSQGFVAMWFHDDLQKIYDTGFSKGISDAGYQPIRVDGVEHIGKIDDQIIAEIRRSRFVVADFTGHRGGVYFEAGFAHGLGLPVFYTCRDDELEKLHFDVRQYNTISWKDAGDLSERLSFRISAVIGDGPKKVLA